MAEVASFRIDYIVAMSSQKQLLKLSEESLMKEPEEVFDLEEKIGEG